MNEEGLGESLLEAFKEVPDPRSTQGRLHPLSAILALSVCAMVSGAHSLYAIAQRGRMQEPVVLKELGFTRDRTPAVSTLHKVFSSMDTDAFESVLGEWIESRLGTGEEAIAVDGKALRGIQGDQIPGVRLVAPTPMTLVWWWVKKGGLLLLLLSDSVLANCQAIMST